MAHLAELKESWRFLHDQNITLDGENDSLKPEHVVAVSRLWTKVSISQSDPIRKRVQESIKTLELHLARHENVYGVNTGCGGNATTRTKKLEELQQAFLQHHQAGILPAHRESHALPLDVARGAMLLRCNSLLRGHSAVRMEVMELLCRCLNKHITPLIPLRGSISASGDLSPLAYVGGLVEGNPDVYVQLGTDNRTVVSAADAMRQAGISPLVLQAKEALGVMNGTAPSAASGALVVHDTDQLAVLTQLLTAMATEALLGTVDNYHEFISQCRPHPGQLEVARNIRSFLAGSRLSHAMDANQQGLVQDRYALRTAPQWLGPVLEDLAQARRQITVELNASTDNPLIDVGGDRFHHGGNFQAAAVTSAMEKTRTALVMLGRLVSAQCQEMVNPGLNKGLPPNLCFDNPSVSFTCKGIDINMAAYFSELAFLTGSVASHVHVAEMNNQSVNSLALIAARYAAQSVDLVSMMCAAHLYVLCQALDLRALDQELWQTWQPRLLAVYTEILGTSANFDAIWQGILLSWHAHTTLDIEPRCQAVAADSVHQMMDDLMDEHSGNDVRTVSRWKTAVAKTLIETNKTVRHRFSREQSTASYLAHATGKMYGWVRHTLQVPLHHGLVDHPGIDPEDRTKRTIGSNVTKIYSAIRNGELVDILAT
ncbi:hypothetical protein ASPZODRAFT_20567 [Penicilliopsis zonata CBS 506.65]|uniref:Phenylalanine ammonia-lyase n=1 Tax=Penicilliopsis zonata CBS 506.65 TaxID=1073090 RepID=A0A1L9S5A3_9EURO|nr:hypothetical protein ASPZODRAFT_20567 [Penicilliopsis zonata CBS 506.65]OJJ42344.1 hypothetical protein ASPZODRAFT_20567 [Penicilliopsis zonata CBS 506.65]